MRHTVYRAAVLPAVGLRGLAPQDAARSYRDVLVRAPQDNGGQHGQRRTKPLVRNVKAVPTSSKTRTTVCCAVVHHTPGCADSQSAFDAARKAGASPPPCTVIALPEM